MRKTETGPLAEAQFEVHKLEGENNRIIKSKLKCNFYFLMYCIDVDPPDGYRNLYE
jgi:hypothetical protein